MEINKRKERSYMNLNIEIDKETLLKLVEICDEKNVGIVEFIENTIKDLVNPKEEVECENGACSIPVKEDLMEHVNYHHSFSIVDGVKLEDEKKVKYNVFTIIGNGATKEYNYKVIPHEMHDPGEKFPSWVTAMYWNSDESETYYEMRFKMNPNQLGLLADPGFIAEIKNISDKIVATSECELALSKKPIRASVRVASDMVEIIYEADVEEDNEEYYK
nr:MAG TPA: Proline dehydrogenase/DNA Complex, Proline, Utilization, DNA, DNA [Caudoviricetes sp.]